ncbi:MAG TPA: DUF4421 family protein, partial [Chryseolinea sp.]|nr:DUF4421 family protein [Chryseolinea sp.]
NWRATGSYIFNNKKFSFRSAYNFTESQLRSAGSFVVFGSVSGFKTEGDSAILGHNYDADFGRDSKVLKFKSTAISFAPGYTYSLIHKGFFINGTVALGPSHNWLYYRTETGETGKDLNFTAFFLARLSLGYNGDRFFGGVSYVSQGVNAKFETVQLNTSTGQLKVLFGYRFREFGFLKKRLLDLPKYLGITS